MAKVGLSYSSAVVLPMVVGAKKVVIIDDSRDHVSILKVLSFRIHHFVLVGFHFVLSIQVGFPEDITSPYKVDCVDNLG